jgi:methyl-accepting chemotaxis protein
MNLRSHLVLAFSMVAAVPLVGGALGILAQRTALAWMEAVAHQRQDDGAAAIAAREAEVAFRTQVQEWKNVLLRGGDPALRRKHEAGLQDAAAAVQAALDRLDRRIGTSDPNFETSAAVRTAHRVLGTQYAAALTALGAAAPAQVAAADRSVAGIDRELATQLAALAGGLEQAAAGRLQERGAAVRAEAMRHSWLLAAGTLLGVAIAGVFGLFTSNAIVRHLRTVVGRMEERTLSVASAAEQVAGSSTSLAGACSDQAAKLEESSAAMAQVQATVKQNAERARGVEAATRDNRAAAGRSAGVLREMTTAMQEISAANRKIGEIVKSIDEIAFQTNLLALNAAVEAARAGEAGAGFSVVAQEVRQLAGRAASAARDSTARIEDAVARAVHGAELAERVAQEIAVLVQNAERMDGLITEIATASREQADAVGGVLQNLTSVDKLTQENAGISEETAAAAETLRQQVNGLETELTRVLAKGDRAAGAAPALVAG